jgi:hypothetical protein
MASIGYRQSDSGQSQGGAWAQPVAGPGDAPRHHLGGSSSQHDSRGSDRDFGARGAGAGHAAAYHVQSSQDGGRRRDPRDNDSGISGEDDETQEGISDVGEATSDVGGPGMIPGQGEGAAAAYGGGYGAPSPSSEGYDETGGYEGQEEGSKRIKWSDEMGYALAQVSVWDGGWAGVGSGEGRGRPTRALLHRDPQDRVSNHHRLLPNPLPSPHACSLHSALLDSSLLFPAQVHYSDRLHYSDPSSLDDDRQGMGCCTIT